METVPGDDAEVTPPDTVQPLYKNRNYIWLMSGQTVSVIGTSISSFAFLFYTLATTQSAMKASTVAGCSIAASAVMGLPAGAIVDRHSRRAAMMLSSAASAAILALLLGCYLTDDAIPFVALIVAALALGCSNAFYSPAERALLKDVVPPRQLGEAMAVNQARYSLGTILGPPLAGVLFGVGRAVPFLFDLATYLVSLLTASRIRSSETYDSDTSELLLARITAGVRWLYRQKPLFAIGWYSTLLNLSMNGITTTIFICLQRSGRTAFELGVFEAIYGVLALLGSVVAVRVTRTVSIGTIAWSCAVMFTAFFSATAISPAYTFLLVLVCGAAALIPIFNSATGAYFMHQTPGPMQGRVSAVLATSAAVLMPLGVWLAGVFLSVTSEPITLLIFSSVLAVATLAFITRPGIRTMPMARDLGSSTTAEATA